MERSSSDWYKKETDREGKKKPRAAPSKEWKRRNCMHVRITHTLMNGYHSPLNRGVCVGVLFSFSFSFYGPICKYVYRLCHISYCVPTNPSRPDCLTLGKI